MPERSPIFRRKLTHDEVKTASILIEKTRWPLFPPPGVEMTVEAGGESFRAAIEAEDCVCVPPAHQHYHLPAGNFASRIDFQPGSTLTIEKIGENRYRIG